MRMLSRFAKRILEWAVARRGYPRVSDGGVVIIDDHGRWKGSREATDEYLAEHGLHVMLHRIDAASQAG